MQTLTPWTEQWQHFTSDVREQFWGDLTQHPRQSWQDFLDRVSVEARDRYLGVRTDETRRRPPVSRPALSPSKGKRRSFPLSGYCDQIAMAGDTGEVLVGSEQRESMLTACRRNEEIS